MILSASSARSLGFAIAILGLTAISSAVCGQQFVHETTSRFPQPDPQDYSSQVAIADIDGDGDLDITFANGRGFASPSLQEPVRILVNDGLGFFTEEGIARTGGLIGYGRDVEYGDADGDGDLDLIVSNDFNTQPRLLINDGNGFFSDESLSRLPAILLSSPHAAWGDVDNDGDLDLWMAKGGSSRFQPGQAQLWLNDGNGFFTSVTATQLPQQLWDSPMDCIFGDLDGDFDLDMVQGHRDVRSRLFRNDGTGTFQDITIGNLPSDDNTYSYDLGDLDNDGDLDLLGANSALGSAREVLFINDGNATFTNQTTSFLPISSNPSVDDNDSKFFDIDNDGDLDFIIASLGSRERICVNNAGTYSWDTSLITAIGDATLDVEVGDLNGDGTLDVVTAQGEGGNFTNRVYMNNGPADTIAPNFPAIEQVDDTADTSGPYVVRVVCRDGMTSDHNFFTQEAVLEISAGGVNSEVPLVWSGGDIYRAEIPGQSGLVTYRARVTDFAGNVGTSGDFSFTVTVITPFLRGDCNTDGGVNIADVVALLEAQFAGGPDPTCDSACDANDDSVVDIADGIGILNTLFAGAGDLPAPSANCGNDPTADSLTCDSSNCP